jgi:hypothetical protein
MRAILTMLLVAGMAWGQAPDSDKPATLQDAGQSPSITVADQGSPARDPNSVLIPAGTKVPLTLKQAISTKNAREGDPVYAETAFPFVVDDQDIDSGGDLHPGKDFPRGALRRRGLKGRAALLIHFTSMIYPTGYTVMLPGQIENTPGAEDKKVKDKEGTIKADNQIQASASKMPPKAEQSVEQ